MKGELRCPPRLDELGMKHKVAYTTNATKPGQLSWCRRNGTFFGDLSQQIVARRMVHLVHALSTGSIAGPPAILEFQSMVASLFGLGVSNASMYDGAAAALVEALSLAMRITTKKSVLMSAHGSS